MAILGVVDAVAVVVRIAVVAQPVAVEVGTVVQRIVDTGFAIVAGIQIRVATRVGVERSHVVHVGNRVRVVIEI
ncbi:MAG: hypothetical protein GWN48_27175, partial [Actinobacteria bacterium]|nr:hypothetical protein [Actinomycetota bacterium]